MQTEHVIMPSDFVMVPGGFRADLYTADQARALPPGGPNDLLAQVASWCENNVAQPSGLDGRAGIVFPFVPESLVRGSLKVSVIPLKNRGEAAKPEIERVAAAFRDTFLAREKQQGRIDIFGVWVMILPDVTAEEAPAVIDTTQRKLKPTFVKEGLMLGEFHPLGLTPGVRNPSFRPLRSPVPLLIVRHMVEADINFLTRPVDSASVRMQSLQAYLQFLGPSLSIASKTKAIEALQLAEADVNHAYATLRPDADARNQSL
jgi:hypothetical protein